jgi:Ca2+-binding RTX toxin-like protein
MRVEEISVAQFPANIDLSSLDGTTGFKLSGAAEGDFSGFSVASAGDVNGDGFADLIVGAWGADPHGSVSGASYVVFGQASGFAANIDLSSLNGITGFQLSGAAAENNSGDSVASAGDVNGDGFADIIIGAPYADPHGTDSGASYVVFGKASGFAANIDLSALDGTTGFKLSGAAADDRSGRSVSSAGDVNGDGFADLIVGAWNADASYVVFGKASGFADNIDLSSLDGATGFKLSGAAADDQSGRSVASAGDVNGDGFADLIVGAWRADPHGTDSGASYVVFGKASGFAANIDLSSLDGTTGFQLSGAVAGDYSGYSVASAGDVNGDGFADLIVGASGAGNSGASYVVFGKATGFAANIDLSSLDGTTGFKLSGAAATDSSGWSVASAGDVNGDGFADVIVGAIGADPHGGQSGASYVVFGQATGFAANIDLSSLDGTTGFKLSGEAAGDTSGRSVASAGDVNGDGFADLIVGAYGADPHGGSSGASYVVFGNLPDTAVNRTGTDAAQTLAGGDFADTLSGLGGDDVLHGNGGNDTLDGGAGDDTAVFGGARADYAIVRNTGPSGTSFTVTDLRGGAPDGTDTLTGIEHLQFSDVTVASTQFPANIDLSSLDGTTGFKLSGTAANDDSGMSVASAGDVNGDGFADLIVGAGFADANGVPNSGASYVVFGHASGFAANTDLSALDGTNGFRLNGAAPGDQSGYTVASAGDVNGDGFADLIVGAFAADPHGSLSGASYVVFGKASGFANIDLSSLDGTTGFKLSGAATGDGSGISVASAGDVNGDGFADLIVGAPFADPHGDNSGASYVLFGKASGFAPNIDLSSLDGTAGFTLSGAAGYASGDSVASAGDVNGDGFADLIVGADSADPHGGSSGASYVVFGKASGFVANIDLSTLDGTTGFKLSGAAASDQSGLSVASAGDVNGDGFADLIVGAFRADAHDVNSGASYVVFGKAAGFDANIDLSSLDGTTGFKLSGAAASDYSGISVASAGDVNGDGFADLIVGAWFASPHGNRSGASYVVFGQAMGFAANIDLSSLDGATGFKLSGAAASDFSGRSVASAGDVNGDGFADLIVGARGADPHGASSGASYVVFGKLPDTAVNRTGTDASQTLAGGDFADTLSGLDGDDALYGNGGIDTLDGGLGNDTIVGGAGADAIDGGGGSNDTASYVSSAVGVTVNLGAGTASGGDAAGDTFSSIENLTGSAQADTLTGDGNANQLDGGLGDDTLAGGAGGDAIDGGLGSDTASYAGSAAGVTVNLGAGTASGGDAAGDTLSRIENLIGSAQADTLTGDGGDNVLEGGAGGDAIDGGLGSDTASYVSSAEGVTVNLGAGTASGGDAQGDTLSGIENLTGSAQADVLTGDDGDNVLEGGASADTLTGGLGNDTASYARSSAGVTVNLAAGTASGGDAAGDTLSGIENIIGSVQADMLTGDGNANTLDGRAGADVMTGGAGNDTYVVDHGGDVLIENAGEGNDAVFSIAHLVLTANVENLVLTGSADLQAYGNSDANTLTGNVGSNLLDGRGGADVMLGGAGNDVYFVDDPGDAVSENPGEGSDAVFSTAHLVLTANVEALVLQGSADLQGYGNSLANALYGNAGSNLLDGRGGADYMAGGAGNDVYVVDDPGDAAIENAGEGRDAIFSTAHLVLPANVEVLVLQGSADLQGYGNGDANTLHGNAGGNLLDGRGGADVMRGGAGNDVYFVDDAGDLVVENANEGTDAVFATVGYTLASNVETLVPQGSGNLAGGGNTLANKLYGNAGDNALDGGGSADRLTGNAGNDTFVFHVGEADGDIVIDFAGNGAAAGDSFSFIGFGTTGDGASLTQIGASNQWLIHSGLGGADETITLLNGASVDPTDVLFT